MAKIPGRLIADLLPNRTVRIVFLPDSGEGSGYPVKETTLDKAELFFMACGLSAEDATTLWAEMCDNKVAGADTVVDEELAAKFLLRLPKE